ncbi:hypothetical protein M5K25_027637 [Dendrobium thyrsiflorum]|uniref:Uncharacterized protein n=1 Tax=Dendrobium thyrsiflorum TaxID=117978 RepID=A0ABD0TUB5_DENTH
MNNEDDIKDVIFKPPNTYSQYLFLVEDLGVAMAVNPPKLANNFQSLGDNEEEDICLDAARVNSVKEVFNNGTNDNIVEGSMVVEGGSNDRFVKKKVGCSFEGTKIKLAKELRGLGPVKSVPRARGVKKNEAFLYLKEFVKDFKIFFVGLVETKISALDRLVFQNMIDDILLFSNAKLTSIKVVKKMIQDYCSWPGQKVNFLKSSILMGKSIGRWKKKQISKMLNIKVVQEMDYLGVKLALRRLRKADFQILLEKAFKKLNVWGNIFISMAGRITLIKSVFLSIPLFVSSHSLVPLGILKEFDKACRNYIWNKHDGSHGLHFVSWEILCKPKVYGGFGLFSAVSRVGPLRARFSWNLLENPNSLLNKNLVAKAWDVPKLSQVFGEELVKLISKVEILQGLDEDRLELKSKLLGKSIPGLCIAAWNAIPTNYYLFHRRLADSSLCPRGCLEVENIDHCTTTCPKLVQVIQLLNAWGLSVPVFISFSDCMKKLKLISVRNSFLAKMYLVLIFHSWINRNRVKHGDGVDSDIVIASRVISVMATLHVDKVIWANWGTNQPSRLFNFWYPPPPKWLKINIDVSL